MVQLVNIDVVIGRDVFHSRTSSSCSCYLPLHCSTGENTLQRVPYTLYASTLYLGMYQDIKYLTLGFPFIVQHDELTFNEGDLLYIIEKVDTYIYVH